MSKVPDTASLVGLLLVASFVIDRVVSGIMFLLSLRRKSLVVQEGRMTRENKNKLIYFGLALVCAVTVVAIYDPRHILDSFNIQSAAEPVFSYLVSIVLLLGGSERLGALLQRADVPAAEAAVSEPIQVTGTLTLEPPPEQAAHTKDKAAAA